MGLVRIMWSWNSCINPVIYASTIPPFKKFVKEVFQRRASGNEEHELERNIKENPSATMDTTKSTPLSQ